MSTTLPMSYTDYLRFGAAIGWDRATILAAYSSSTLVAGLFGIPVGRATDRRGAARGLLTVGSVVTGAAPLAGANELLLDVDGRSGS